MTENRAHPGSKQSFVASFLERRRAKLIPVDQIPPGTPYFCGKLPFVLLLVLALVGTFAAGFLTYRHIELVTHAEVEESSLCRADGRISCDAVLLSGYATLFEYFPSSSVGLMGMVFALWLIVNALFIQRLRKVAVIFLILYFFTSIGFSSYFIYLLMYKVDYVCPWCIVVHVVNFSSLFVLAIVAAVNRQNFLLEEIAPFPERFYYVAGGVLLALVVFFSAGWMEKMLNFENARLKYEQLANDPVVVMAMLKASPTHNVPVTDADPVYGSRKAPFPIILFTDYQCPVCARTDFFLRSLVNKNRDVLRIVYKSYPLAKACNKRILNDLHPLACRAAQAACAAFLLQGDSAFQAYTELLFINQHSLTEKSWVDIAERIGLNLERFNALMQEDSVAAQKVVADIREGSKLNIRSTPQIVFLRKRLPETFKANFLAHILEDMIREAHPDSPVDLRVPPPVSGLPRGM
jgi:uncharacterized membrane protein/protein-disulfide isomerase